MPVEQVFWAFAGRILSGLFGRPVVTWLKNKGIPRLPRRWTRLWFYKTELAARLKRMPFIYAGIEADVLNDFVSIELDRLNQSTLESREAGWAFKVDPWQVLKDRRYVAIIGSAGIGKTTFERHTILELLGGRAKFLHEKERLVPLYVPLKIVPNNGPAPIYRFILASEPFAGDVDYLLSVARRQGLFLCLDGYDEIALTGTTENYIQQELYKLFFGPTATLALDKSISSNSDFHALVKVSSRVWLTSRPQFMQHHPIGPIGNRSDALESSVATIGIVGIGQNRESLVRRVFERYSSIHIDVGTLLNSEYFLQLIDRAPDGEIRDMSFNPLFLTVMTYYYAQTVLKEQKHDIEIAGDFSELILQCIDLLLVDLDEYKARQLPPAQKLAVENRRNEFIPEKKAFLRYLAGIAYLREIPIFTESSLTELLLEYLNLNPTSSAPQILRGFHDGKSDRPSFVRQLIYCGVFVLVDATRSEKYYDFPHRRFREVLAASYFSYPPAYVQFLYQHDARGQAALVELTAVLKKSTGILSVGTQAGALQLILDEMITGSNSRIDFFGLTDAFVSLMPKDLEVESIISAFLEQVMMMREPRFEASNRILKLRRPLVEDVPKFQRYIKDRCEAEDAYGVAFGCSVLREYSEPSLVELVRELLVSGPHSAEVTSVLARICIDRDGKEIDKCLELLLKPPVDRWGIYHAIGSTSDEDVIVLAKGAWSLLTDEARLDFILCLTRLVETRQINEDIWVKITQAVAYPYDRRGLAILRSRTIVPRTDGGDFFFLNATSASAIGDELENQKKSRKLVEGDSNAVPEKLLALRKTARDRDQASMAIEPGASDLYAAIPEGRVREVRVKLDEYLLRFHDSFLNNFAEIESGINQAVGSIFKNARFESSKTIVAFASENAIFSERDLKALVKKRALATAAWNSAYVSQVACAWPRIPEPLVQIPKFFIGTKSSN
jgi:hypothetical protein